MTDDLTAEWNDAEDAAWQRRCEDAAGDYEYGGYPYPLDVLDR